MQAIASRKSHLVACSMFWAWALVGVGYGFGVSVIGAFTFIPATLGVVFLTRRRPVRGAWGVATGIGSVFLLIAYINRNGGFNPTHWLIAGLVLFVGGIVAHAWTDRETD
jgi:hypothetical protein